MELATTLETQDVRVGVREVGINPNHWYAVAWAQDLQPGQVIAVTVWNQPIALYRTTSGQLHAVENICPHKGVDLHRGDVIDEHLVCNYHGWEFNPQGQCVKIPYLPTSHKLPCASLRVFPVQETYGLIWVFPGDAALAETCPPLDIPEYDDPNWLMVPIGAHFQAHFSICNENTMDVFHGYLHKNLQGWYNPVLLQLKATDDRVSADYQVSYRGVLAKWLGLSETSQATTKVISVNYRYPHYQSSLEGVSSIYLMRLPIGPVESRSFALFFLKIRVPTWIQTLLRPVLQPAILHFLFMRFLVQDIEMIESEQRNYLAQPQRRYVEINPAIIAVQRLIVRQYEDYIHQSEPRSPKSGHKSSGDPVSSI